MFIKIILITTLFTLSSCNKHDTLFESYLYNSLFKTTQLDIVSTGYINSGAEIISPPYTLIPLIIFKTIDGSKFELSYKTPLVTKNSKENGILIFSKKIGPSLKEITRINITSLKIFYPNNRIHVQRKILFPGHLYLSFKYKKANIFISIPLANIKKTRVFKKHNSSYTAKLLGGVTILPKNKMIATSINRLENNKLCHQLSDDCEELIPYSCDRCPDSWYEVVSSNCKKAYSKICGTDLCGTLDNPACPKGFKAGGDRFDPEHKFRASFCQKDLEPSDGEHEIVVCK